MKAILFDFDGVIIRSMEDHFEGWRQALAEYGIEMSPEELYVMEGARIEELANQFTRKFNLPYEETPNIVRKKREHYDSITSLELYPNLIDLLNWISERELKTGLVTGRSREAVAAALAGFGMTDYFPVLVTADDVRHTKPSPEPYLLAARMLDVDPADCIVVENAPFGIRSALAAKMRCIAVTSTLSPMFLKEADVVTDDLQQVLNALKRMY